MLIRELQKGKQTWQLVLGGHACTVVSSQKERREIERTVTRKSEFDDELAKRLTQGWKETDASRSRRVFLDGTETAGKFWIIKLDEDSYTIQYGKVARYGYHPESGQKQVKYFDSADEARLDYHKQIDKKLKEGYKEYASRKTEYSELPAHLKDRKTVQRKPSGKPQGSTTTSDTNKIPQSAKQLPAETRAEPAPEKPPVTTEVTHHIDLDPRDWFWAMWRDPDPLPRPEPRPFDLNACLEAIRNSGSRGGRYTIKPPGHDVPLSPEEAHFWNVALQMQRKERTPRSLCEALAKQKFTGDYSIEELNRWRKKGNYLHFGYLADMLNPEKYVELLFSLPHAEGHEVFRQKVLPYLSRQQRTKLAKDVSQRARTAKLPRNFQSDYDVSYYLAAALGCHDVVDMILKQTGPSGHWYSRTEFIWGLESADRVESEVDRIRSEGGNPLWRSNGIRAWLAHTELRRLDVIRDAITRSGKGWGGMAQAAETLALVKAPEAAPMFLELRQAGKAPDVATTWLDQQLGNAVTGLVPLAAGQGQLAKAAQSYLREKQRLGYGKVIEDALKTIPDSDAKRLRQTALNVPEFGPPFDEKSTPKKLAALIAEAAALKPLAGSDWVDVRRLPPLSASKHTFTVEQVNALLLALQHSEFNAPAQPLVVQIREWADAESLAEFAWGLFELWLAHDAPSKHKWAIRALGFLGNDDTALRLTPLVRAWPGESQHPRAVLGLECLRTIGSDTALMQLSGIAQKIKFKALQQRAMECVEAIAAEKGMSRDELEDRVVPDCGLDERGSRVFDFGPRKFFFGLNGENKPVVRDEEGKLRGDLPKPSGKDDAGKAKEAMAEWTALKKQIREVVKIQNTRLEQALITGRRWSVANFETLLVRHPLMTNLARRLLWAGFDSKGKRKRTFRITEERDYSDASDEPVTLADCRDIGLVHPLHLDEHERARWSELFADYEIVPPFPQLGRPVHELSAAEKKDNSFKKFEGLTIPALSLLGILDRCGWTRGLPQDNGVFKEHYKHFFAANLTAIVTYEWGIAINFYGQEQDQDITGCYLIPGIYKPRGWPNHKDKIKLGTVDPVVVSEVITDLTELEAKAL